LYTFNNMMIDFTQIKIVIINTDIRK